MLCIKKLWKIALFLLSGSTVLNGMQQTDSQPLAIATLEATLFNIIFGNEKEVRQSVETGFDVNQTANENVTQEITNVWGNPLPETYLHPSLTEIIIAGAGNGMATQLTSKSGLTPLMAAAINQTTSAATITRFLIDKGANVNARDSNNVTPLMYAAAAANVTTLTVLLKAGADATATDIDGHTAITYAACASDNFHPLLCKDAALCIKILLQAGTSPDADKMIDNYCRFTEAKIVLEAARVQKRIIIATRTRDIKKLIFALANVIDGHIHDKLTNDSVPYAVAQTDGWLPIIQVLERWRLRKPRVRPSQTASKMDLVTFARMCTKNSVQAVQECWRANFDVNQEASEAETARITNDVSLLPKQQAEFAIKLSSGITPLMIAAAQDHSPDACAVRLLIENGADITARTSDYFISPLMFAAAHDALPNLKALLTNGSYVDYPDYYCRTALMYAASSDSARCMVALLQAGANPNMADFAGEKTAVDYAHTQQCRDILRLATELATQKDARVDHGIQGAQEDYCTALLKIAKESHAEEDLIKLLENIQQELLSYDELVLQEPFDWAEQALKARAPKPATSAAASTLQALAVPKVIVTAPEVVTPVERTTTKLMDNSKLVPPPVPAARTLKPVVSAAVPALPVLAAPIAPAPKPVASTAEPVAAPNINELGTDGLTQLMQAVKNGNVEEVKQLLARGADPKIKSREGKTALMYNAKNDKEISGLLFKASLTKKK